MDAEETLSANIRKADVRETALERAGTGRSWDELHFIQFVY
jgi:hypothetical protein